MLRGLITGLLRVTSDQCKLEERECLCILPNWINKQLISCPKVKRIPMLILKSLTEVQVLKCSVEIGITITNQKDKTDIWEISEVRTKVFT